MVINKSGAALESVVALKNFPAAAKARAWRSSPANLGAIQVLPKVPVAAGALNAELPADSITLYLVPVAGASE